jgi:hypothetical protein
MGNPDAAANSSRKGLAGHRVATRLDSSRTNLITTLCPSALADLGHGRANCRLIIRHLQWRNDPSAGFELILYPSRQLHQRHLF